MAWKTVYAPAFAAAFAVFAVTGGIQASEKIIKAEEQRPLGVDATLSFPNSGNIRDWRADGTEALYVQDNRGQWYRAALFGPCNELMTANQIAFLTRGPDQLDKYSTIVVRGQRCSFNSFVTSAAPPKHEKAKSAKG
jgi:hypothetical protein